MTTKNYKNKPLEILVVEDNPGDVKLFLNEFKEFEFIANFHVQTNGEEALKFLHKEGKYDSEPHPDLIVLDLKLPIKSGIEVLTDISEHRNLRETPVVIFSSLPLEKQIVKNCERIPYYIFIPKPADLDGYAEVVKTVEKFWFDCLGKIAPKTSLD